MRKTYLTFKHRFLRDIVFLSSDKWNPHLQIVYPTKYASKYAIVRTVSRPDLQLTRNVQTAVYFIHIAQGEVNRHFTCNIFQVNVYLNIIPCIRNKINESFVRTKYFYIQLHFDVSMCVMSNDSTIKTFYFPKL